VFTSQGGRGISTSTKWCYANLQRAATHHTQASERYTEERQRGGRALIGEAARRGLGLNLSVRSENPARHLCERLGFRDIPGSAVTNRVGGVSIGMALSL
jgi:hypothetical protein